MPSKNRFGTSEQSLLLVTCILFVLPHGRVSALVALPQSTHLPYCNLPAETCRLARPAPLPFVGVWRLFCTAEIISRVARYIH